MVLNQKDIKNKAYISTCITTNEEKEVINQENLYNGSGKRIQKKEGNNVVNYYYQNGVVLYTTDEDGNKTRQNFVVTKEKVMDTTRHSKDGFISY